MGNGLTILIANVIALLAIVVPIIVKYQMNLQATLSQRFAQVDVRFEKLTADFNNQAIQINSILVGDIRELRDKAKAHEERLRDIETGKTEWMRILRKRSHWMANELNTTILDVELLKQGKVTKPRQPRPWNDIEASDVLGDE